MSIQFVIHKEIDKTKWDNCIQHAVNGFIYANSFYLDALAQNWDALVLNDYEAVMPLTWRSKWGIRYLYQPSFIQQLGIFYTNELSEKHTRAFLEAAFERFKFAEITLNYSNKIDWADDNIKTNQRNNFMLDLNRSYEALYDNYDPSFTKSLRRVRKFNLVYLESMNFKRIIDLYKELYGRKMSSISDRSYVQLQSICNRLLKEKNVIVRLVRNSENRLLAAVVMLKYQNRLYNIISCISGEGKRREANYLLYDNLINEFANSPLMLDFEGSDIEGVAAFYKKFNPVNQPYPFVKWNNLPWYIKIFKR
ncbi:MAG: hypothetical protein QM737_14945 [Ferruginibacter sp.]